MTLVDNSPLHNLTRRVLEFYVALSFFLWFYPRTHFSDFTPILIKTFFDMYEK